MAKTASTTTEALATEKKTRTILSPAERIAKMEADLAAEREKIQDKSKAKHAKALDELSVLTTKAEQLQAKVTAKKAEVDALHELAYPGTSEQPELPVDES